VTEEDAQQDGRRARRDRNRTAVLDAVIELFSEGHLQPRPEDVAERSGVSLRSVYRYYSDRDQLRRAAMERHLEGVAPLFEPPGVGDGSLRTRIARFVDARLALHAAIAPAARAARLAMSSNEVVRARYEAAQDQLRRQTDQQFAPELAAMAPAQRSASALAIDVLVQIEGLDHLLDRHGLAPGEVRDHLCRALATLLSAH
jgi:AcrR family transcriptional regulator